jgi:hypothetical protein
MSNFGTMVQRIKDETLRDTSSDAAYAKKAIVSAIDFFKHYRFWFNESLFSISVTDGGNYYTSVSSGTAGYPRDLIEIDHVSIGRNSNTTVLTKVGIQEYLDRFANSSTEGWPEHWAFHGEKLFLHPTPDAAYTLSAYYIRELAVDDPGTATVYGPGILANYTGGAWVFEDPDGNDLTDACTNAWFVEAEQLIRAKAKSYVYGEVLRDSKAAAEMEGLAMTHFANLKAASERFEMPARIVPWY